MSEPQEYRRQRTLPNPRWWFLAFPLGALVVFALTLNAGWVSDDFEAIALAKSPDGLQRIFSETLGGSVYRPLFFLSFWLEHHVWGGWEPGYHLTNVLLHGLNAGVLWLLFRRWRLATWAAWLGALWFLVYPAHHESVTWLSGRTDVLATTGVLLALWCFENLSLRRWHRWGLVGATVLALLTKEIGLAIPLLLALRTLTLPRDVRREHWRFVAVTLALVAGALVLRRFIVGSWIGGYALFGESIVRTLRQSEILATLREPWQMLTASLNQPFLRSFWELHQLPDLALRATLGLGRYLPVLATGGLILLASRRAWRGSVLALVALGITLAPSVPLLRYVSTSLEATRFWYLPTAALALLIAVLASGSRWPRWSMVSGGVLLAVSLVVLQWNAFPWRFAGQESAAIRTAVDQIATTHAPTQFAIFKQIPDNRFGAYVFRRGLGEYLDVWHPDVFPARTQINRTYAPALAACPRADQAETQPIVYAWQTEDRRLTAQSLALVEENPTAAEETRNWSASSSLPGGHDHWRAHRLTITPTDSGLALNPSSGSYLSTSVPDLSPLRLPRLRLSGIVAAQRQTISLSLYWAGENEPYDEYQRHIIFPFPATGAPETVTLDLCQYAPWVASASLTAIRLQFPGDIKSFALTALSFLTE